MFLIFVKKSQPALERISIYVCQGKLHTLMTAFIESQFG